MANLSYVPKKELKEPKELFMRCLDTVRGPLKKDLGVTFQFFLVGSGARNMVIRYPEKGADLDYQLQIMAEGSTKDDELKRTITDLIDSFMLKEGYKHGENSTSSITYVPESEQNQRTGFSYDVAITKVGSDGRYCILRAHKEEKKIAYSFEPLGIMALDQEKVSFFKHNGLWGEARDEYLRHKEEEIDCQSGKKSFQIYCETVNEIYFKHKTD